MVGYITVDAAEAPATIDAARIALVDGAGHATDVTPVRDGELEPAPTAQHRAASFIVDYDQPPLTAMCEGPAWSADEALRQADARIARKSLAIPFVTASVAAQRREGDCTEHAVLAAALLRCHGHAARLAVGVIVWHAHGRWIAGGHMWAERYDHGWRVADATRPEGHGEVAYLRFGAIDDEGPAVAYAVMSRLRQQAALRVRVTAR